MLVCFSAQHLCLPRRRQ